MSANIRADGESLQLDKRAASQDLVRPEDVTDASKLARMISRSADEIAAVKRRWSPRRVDFEGIVTAGTINDPQRFALAHNLNGPVRWWIVRLTNPTGASNTLLVEVDGTDENTLVLDAYFPATITLRVEEAGA